MKANFSKYYYLVLLVSSIALLGYSYYFALERVVSSDTAAYFFNIVNNETFNFGSYRFIAVFTQVIPLILVKINAPFNLILNAYSVNMILFHLSVLLIIAVWCKDVVTALILLCSHLISSALMFYYPVSEYQMGLTLTVLLYALLINKKIQHSKLYWFFVGALLLVISYSHPLIILFVSVIFLFVWLNNTAISKSTLIGLFVLFLFFYYSKYLLFEVPNDSGNMIQLKHLKFFPVDAFQIFWSNAVHYDFVLLIVFMLTLIVLVILKKFKWLAFFVLFVYLNFYLALSKLGNQGYMYYHAHIYQTLAFIISFFFIYFSAQIKAYSIVKKVVLCVVFLIGLVQIFNRSSFSRERISYFNTLIDQTQKMGTNRGLIEPSKLRFGKNGWFWAMDIETLICSKYEHKELTTVVIRSKEITSKSDLEQNNLFILYWTVLKSEDVLNPYYFPLKPGTYKFLNQ